MKLTDNAGTVESLLDQDTNEWFFIEMNPRIQLNIVTEQITGIDIVRSQILVAMEKSIHGKEIGIPNQTKLEMDVHSMPSQLRIRKDFTPDYGKILSYRSAAGFGVRLDGAMVIQEPS